MGDLQEENNNDEDVEVAKDEKYDALEENNNVEDGKEDEEDKGRSDNEDEIGNAVGDANDNGQESEDNKDGGKVEDQNKDGGDAADTDQAQDNEEGQLNDENNELKRSVGKWGRGHSKDYF